MTVRQITLPDDVEAFIDAQLEAGAYGDPSELVADAVRRLASEGEPDDLSWLRDEVQARLNDSRPSVPADDVWRMLEEQAAKRRD